MLEPLAIAGNVGVPIFFVISGYVIALTATHKTSWQSFLMARFIRLFPGLILCMTIVLLVGPKFIQPYESPGKTFIGSVSLLYDLIDVQPLTTVLWTLLVEWKFYLAVAFMLLVNKNIFNQDKRIIAILLAFELLRISKLFGIYDLINFEMKLSTIFFTFGITMYYLIRNLRNKITLCLLIAMLTSQSIGILSTSSIIGVKEIFFVVMSAIVFSSIIKLPRRLSIACGYLGLASYPIYLLHTHLGIALGNVISTRIIDDTTALTFTILLLTSISLMLCILLEIPIQKVLKSVKLKKNDQNG